MEFVLIGPVVRGWTSVQLRVLHELVYSARRIPNAAIAIRLATTYNKTFTLCPENVPSPGHTHFFFWWDLMMGFGKPQLHAKFEIAGFICNGNIRNLFLNDKFAF